MRKNNQGITLIALVITIIVLLILAGVSIAMLTGGNGLLSKAVEARVENYRGEVCDRINTALNAEYAELLAAQYGAGTQIKEDSTTGTGQAKELEDINGFTTINSDAKENVKGKYEITLKKDTDKADCELVNITWKVVNKEYGADITGSIKRTKDSDKVAKNEVPYKVEPALTGSSLDEATD